MMQGSYTADQQKPMLTLNFTAPQLVLVALMVAGMAAGAGAAQDLGHYFFVLEGVSPASGQELRFESFNLLPNGTLIFRAAVSDSGNESKALVSVRLQSDDVKDSLPATAVRSFSLTVRFHPQPVAETTIASPNITTAVADTLLTTPTTPTTTPTLQEPLKVNFDVLPQVVAVEGTNLRLPGFVYNIRGQSPAFLSVISPASAGNNTSAVAVAAGRLAPAVSPAGELALSVPQGLFGRFRVVVEWAGGNSNNSCSASLTCIAPAPGIAEPAVKATAMLVVLPLPRLKAVVPALGPARGSTLITVHGTYFGFDTRHPPSLSTPLSYSLPA
jgi:hypothetical protein